LANLVRASRERRRSAAARGRGALVEYLAFRLAGELYAVPVTMVQEIVKPPLITPVPRAPSYILGIMSGRGRVVTVIDTRRKLGLVELPATTRSRVLIADTGDERIGLWVDEVLMVFRFGESEIERSSLAVGGDVADHIAGIARPIDAKTDARGREQVGSSDVLILLDLKALLS
jgi:purine-binding chemotaxis protein CheW